MTEDMKPTTPETVQPQWVDHLPVISPEMDKAIDDELKEEPKIMTEEKTDGKSPL